MLDVHPLGDPGRHLDLRHPRGVVAGSLQDSFECFPGTALDRVGITEAPAGAKGWSTPGYAEQRGGPAGARAEDGA